MQYICADDHVVLQGAMKVNMTKSHFNLLQFYFGSNSLWQTSYLKDNSWMCILNQYHKASRLKVCTAMCRSEKNGITYIFNEFKMVGDTFLLQRFPGVGGGGDCCPERILKNYIKIHWKSMQAMIFIFRCTLWYNFLGYPTRQHEVWRKTLLHYVNTNWYDQKYITQRIFPLTKSAAVHLLHWY